MEHFAGMTNTRVMPLADTNQRSSPKIQAIKRLWGQRKSIHNTHTLLHICSYILHISIHSYDLHLDAKFMSFRFPRSLYEEKPSIHAAIHQSVEARSMLCIRFLMAYLTVPQGQPIAHLLHILFGSQCTREFSLEISCFISWFNKEIWIFPFAWMSITIKLIKGRSNIEYIVVIDYCQRLFLYP